MDAGQSISFTSFDSYNYPSHHNLTFHENDPMSSRHDLVKDSTIRNFPGRRVNLAENLEIMLLLQTAEIERLTLNLHEYRMKFKRILNNEKDYNSFKNQADQLLQVKDELELRNKKMYQFAQNQKGELVDQYKYVQILENKYRRALKIIEEAHLVKQQAEQSNAQLREEISTIQKTFDAFKQKSIEEYQILRDQLEKAKNEELSFQMSKYANQKQRWGEIIKREETKFSLEREKYESLLDQERNKLTISVNEIERLKKEIAESQQYLEQLNFNHKKIQQEKENHFVLMGTEFQRLNSVLKDKNQQIRNMEIQMQDFTAKINQKNEEAENYKRQHERYRHKCMLYEEQTNKQNEEIANQSTNISTLTNKINELVILIEQKNVELKLKDNKYNQQIENYRQTLNKSEFNFNREAEEARIHVINIAKQLQRTRKQLIVKEEAFNQTKFQFQSKLQSLESQKMDLNIALNRQINKSKSLQDKFTQQNKENVKLIKESEILRKKVEEVYSQKRAIEESYRKEQRQLMQKSNRIYEQKWEELNEKYIQSNQKINELLQGKQNMERTIYSLKNSLERSEIEKEEIRKCRTFESMINEIESLCQKTIEKQSEISELKKVITNLERQTRQVKKQIGELHEIIVKLVNIHNANESNRREDNFLMIEEIKKLFLQHAIVIDEVKENTHKIAFNYQRHKQFIESSQSHIVKSKQLQIQELKERLNLSTKQTQSKNELKDIINKIITITKQNTELKVTMNKKALQNQQLFRQLQSIKQEIHRNSELANLKIYQKDQMCKKILFQLQESNSLLFEERQNQLKLQSSLIILEEEKDKNNKEVETRANIIKQLKNAIKTKEECIHDLKQKIEQIEKARSKLKEELNETHQAKVIVQLLNSEKQQLIAQLKERVEKNQQNLKARQSQFERNRKQMIQKLSQSGEENALQISKLKSQLNSLIAQNNDLKQQIIKTGSSILALTEANQHLQNFEMKYRYQLEQIQNYKKQAKELLQGTQELQMIKYQFQNCKIQCEHAKRQLERHQRLALGSSQKIQILQKELQRMESIVEDFKVQNSNLQSSNYEFSLIIQKSKVSQQKILILSEEIDRLQRERVDFIEELNTYRLQISQDCSLDRRVQESQLLLVESLRSLLLKKDQQIEDLRKATLK